MEAPKIEIALSDKKNHLIFTQNTYDEHGLSTETKRGSKPIERGKADKALAFAKTRTWEFSGEPGNGGFYEMTDVTDGATAPEASEVGENEVVQ